AFLTAANGGGVPDPNLVNGAKSQVHDQDCADYIGHSVLGTLELCWANGEVAHPDAEHRVEQHPLGNLSGDSCRMNAGQVCANALSQAIGTGMVPPINSIAGQCPDGLPFNPICIGTMNDY